MLVNEIIDGLKKCSRKNFVLKLDFEKAYDNVEWGFLISVMRQMGFGEIWCGWILECL